MTDEQTDRNLIVRPRLHSMQRRKSQRDTKWYGHSLSSCKVWWRSAAARRHEKRKLVVFILFVCHAVDLELRFSHSNRDIVAIYRTTLMQISPFFREKTALSKFTRHLNYAAKWHHIYFVLELCRNLNFSKNSKSRVCAPNFDHLEQV